MAGKKSITIKRGGQFLMLKISSPAGVSFLEEHQKLISKKQYVWFCRFGKCNLLVNSIGKDGMYLFVKESKKNGGGRYLLEFSEVTSDAPKNGYPEYYDELSAEKSLWFKVTAIHKLSDDFEKHFETSSSGNSLDSVYRSMCNSFYIMCCKDYMA